MERLSVVIPCYNEEFRIEKTIRIIDTYLSSRKFNYEIIVVDDGSTDGTTTTLSTPDMPKTKLISASHRGKGGAVRIGVEAATGDWVLVTDADLSAPIEELEMFLKTDAPVVIGSRGLSDSTFGERQSRYREIGGKILNRVIQLVTLPGIHDTQCGFKLFKSSAAKEIFKRHTIPGWGFDIETLYIARSLGYRIAELPVHWSNDTRTKVHPIRNGLTILADLFRIRFNSLKGKYK